MTQNLQNERNPKKYIGIDYGTKRIGIAVSDESGSMAFPHKVLENKGIRDAARSVWEMTAELCTVKDVVIGESRNFKGEDNAVMSEVRRFADELQNHGLRVVLEPEIMSTIQAERLQGQRSDIDASAAAVILQSYLDRLKKESLPEASLEEIEGRKYTEQTRFD